MHFGSADDLASQASGVRTPRRSDSQYSSCSSTNSLTEHRDIISTSLAGVHTINFSQPPPFYETTRLYLPNSYSANLLDRNHNEFSGLYNDDQDMLVENLRNSFYGSVREHLDNESSPRRNSMRGSSLRTKRSGSMRETTQDGKRGGRSVYSNGCCGHGLDGCPLAARRSYHGSVQDSFLRRSQERMLSDTTCTERAPLQTTCM